MAPAPPQRHIALNCAFNVRDVGGYATQTGRTVRWGTVLRGDALHRLDRSDVESLRPLGLRTVVDLRTAEECANHGVAPSHEWEADLLHLPLISELWDLTELGDDVVGYLATRYIEMIERGGEVLGTIIEIVARANDSVPVIVHCTAGKDRTGVTVGVLLSLLGVDDATVAADYALSAPAMEAQLEFFHRTDPANFRPPTEQPSAFREAPSQAMFDVLAHIREQHGSTERFIRSQGVDDAAISALRSRLLT